jgi:DNA-binding NtrC family response regulator
LKRLGAARHETVTLKVSERVAKHQLRHPLQAALKSEEVHRAHLELENVIERAMIRSSGDTLQLDDTFGNVRGAVTAVAVHPGEILDSVQRSHIEAILAQTGGRINGRNNAAERLGLHLNTLRFRMNKLGIVGPDRCDPQIGVPISAVTLSRAERAQQEVCTPPRSR